MGSSSSKPAQRLGNHVSASFKAPEAQRVVRATTVRAIERDAMDPQLIRNLASLGQVATGGSNEAVQRHGPMTGILAARDAAAGDETGLSAGDLVLFLDEYKHSQRTPEILERLAIEYDIPKDKAAALVRWFSTPGQQPLRW
ncbi:hypothetical protein MCUN1_001573 [Malassezia cuniculi]|uniref:Uncharacterized protein n=1 Tax=Malassezia cuniculi TaxID=948313 RepID=A0AAF0EUC5_9BASI|nr:hypothetical protein MCUN1_001573 [Malassezia cuniculi]